MEPLFKRLDFGTAWSRCKRDLANYGFVDHPFETQLIENDLDVWIDQLRGEIENSTYTPDRCRIVNFPKANWHIRPGGALRVEDHVVFSALILDAVPYLRKQLSWSEKSLRCSSILASDDRGLHWFQFEMDGWSIFREKSVELIDQGHEYMLSLDISAFFENVDLGRLSMDLRACGVPNDTIELLGKCLNRWAEPRGRGIPQGFRPSGLLAELYLNSIDRRLFNDDIKVLRYVDDIRIFCRTKKQAIANMQTLTELLRDKGLNLQTAKSEILKSAAAREELTLIPEIIAAVKVQIQEDVKRLQGGTSPYSSPSELELLFKKLKGKIDVLALRRAFDEYFIDPKVEFDKSLFHFLLNRLAAVNDSHAVDYCIRSLSDRPEETRFVLDYLGKVDTRIRSAERIGAAVNRRRLLVPHQLFLIVKWLLINAIHSERLVKVVRRLLHRTDLAFHLRDYAIAYLGNWGDFADLDLIETEYANTLLPVSRATILLSIRRMEPARRNSIYGRTEGESFYTTQAIRISKSTRRLYGV